MIVTRAANKSILITRMQTDGHIKDIVERVLPKYFMRNKNGWDATTVASVFIFVRFANSILITGEMQNLWPRGECVALFLAENNGDTITERVSKLLLLLNIVISAATRATKTDNAFVMLCGIVVCTRLLALTFWTASHSSAIWPNDFSAVFSTSFGKRGRPKAKCKIDLSNQQNKNESWAHPFPTILWTFARCGRSWIMECCRMFTLGVQKGCTRSWEEEWLVNIGYWRFWQQQKNERISQKRR